MAFVAVTQVSPIIAAGSAIALSLGLVLTAYTAGARLRDLARHLSSWIRDLAALAILLLLIAAVIGVATDLRPLTHASGEIDRLRSVWLFSDLLKSVAAPTEILLSHSEGLIQSGESTLALAGIDVHVAGIGRFHDRHRRPLTSREYGFLIGCWTAFVCNSRGELHVTD